MDGFHFFNVLEFFLALEINFRFLDRLDGAELGRFGIAISCGSCFMKDSRLYHMAYVMKTIVHGP